MYTASLAFFEFRSSVNTMANNMDIKEEHLIRKIQYNENWVIPEKIHPNPTIGKLEILTGGGVDGSGNPGGKEGSEHKNSSLVVLFNFNLD